MEINLTKISLSHGMFPVVSYKELLPGNDERVHSNVRCTSPAHNDLIKAFADFILPLALICEEITNEQYISALPNEYDATAPSEIEMGEIIHAIKASKSKKGKQLAIVPEIESAESLTDRFHINTVEFKTTNGIEKIVLTGEKKLSTNKWMGLGPTPSISINEDEYLYVSDLFAAGELLKHELGEYIINHKYAPPVDPELPFGERDRESFGDGVGLTEQELREGSEEQVF